MKKGLLIAVLWTVAFLSSPVAHARWDSIIKRSTEFQRVDPALRVITPTLPPCSQVCREETTQPTGEVTDLVYTVRSEIDLVCYNKPLAAGVSRSLPASGGPIFRDVCIVPPIATSPCGSSLPIPSEPPPSPGYFAFCNGGDIKLAMGQDPYQNGFHSWSVYDPEHHRLYAGKLYFYSNSCDPESVPPVDATDLLNIRATTIAACVKSGVPLPLDSPGIPAPPAAPIPSGTP